MAEKREGFRHVGAPASAAASEAVVSAAVVSAGMQAAGASAAEDMVVVEGIGR
jgi:hypothetical protein